MTVRVIDGQAWSWKVAEIVAIYFRINSHGVGVEDLNPCFWSWGQNLSFCYEAWPEPQVFLKYLSLG